MAFSCYPGVTPSLICSSGNKAIKRQVYDFPSKTGAGERIRTVDPNLGKVMLSLKSEAECGVSRRNRREQVPNGTGTGENVVPRNSHARNPSTSRSGRRGRRFESSLSDHLFRKKHVPGLVHPGVRRQYRGRLRPLETSRWESPG